MSIPEYDAWGNKYLLETNSSSIVLISRGVDSEDTSDDVRLDLECDSGFYAISYSYDSYHFSTACFPESEKMSDQQSGAVEKIE